MQGRFRAVQRRIDRARAIALGLMGAEWAVLAVWTLIVTRSYFNLDAAIEPAGREYMSSIQAHFLWQHVQQCGRCALWNGDLRGGAPALVDPQDAMLHPVVIVPTLIWGVLNGAKIGLVGTFFLAGLAQWWLALVLRVGRAARLWSSAMAIAAGNLSGRMDDGVYAVVVSTVACALTLPPMIQLCRDGRRRSAAVLGITLALAAVAGQGYLQIGLALCAPALLFLLVSNPLGVALLVRRLGLAVAIGALIAAPFLVPVAHALPSFAKDLDPAFTAAQPFAAVPLNLVINDPDFYRTNALHKLPYPYLYVNYIGWIAVLLAVVGVVALWPHRRRMAFFLPTTAILAMWISSATPLRWLVNATAFSRRVSEFFAGVRNPAVIAGLAVAPLLALAAVGVDSALKPRCGPLRLRIGLGGADPAASRELRVDLRLLLIVPLAVSLHQARVFSANWLGTARQPVETMSRVLAALHTPDLQWVNPPFGEEFWLGLAHEQDLKLSPGIRPWNWTGRAKPEPVREAGRAGPPPGMSLKGMVAGLSIFVASPGREYAAITHADGTRTVCTAHGGGADIDVTCDAPQPGRLTVEEYSAPGWSARVNGASGPVLNADGWLAVDVAAGRNVVALRYRPWDVPVGLLLMLAGLGLAGYCIWEPRSASRAPDAGAANASPAAQHRTRQARRGRGHGSRVGSIPRRCGVPTESARAIPDRRSVNSQPDRLLGENEPTRSVGTGVSPRTGRCRHSQRAAIAAVRPP